MIKQLRILTILLVLTAFHQTLAFRHAWQDTASGTQSVTPKSKRLKSWGEIYNESTAFRRNDDNLIASSHIRQGLRFYWTSSIYTEMYTLIRYGKDLHRDFWNNRFELGFGLRTRFFKKLFLAFYTEWIEGSYLKIPDEYPQPYDKRYNDLRAGLIFWYGWDKWFSPKRWIAIPIIFWGEIYSEINYFRSQENNVTGYMQSRVGFHLIRLWKSDIDVYGVVNAMKDVKNYFWNNKAEGGGGVWLKPWSELSLKFYAEWIGGMYYGIEGEDPNPYSQRYWDRRVGVLLWIGW